MDSMSWLAKVKDMLVGRTILDVIDCEVPSMIEDDMVDSEGIVLILDNGDHVRVAVDYEDVDFLVDDVTPGKYEGLEGDE
jgi:hypothetical protein